MGRGGAKAGWVQKCWMFEERMIKLGFVLIT